MALASKIDSSGNYFGGGEFDEYNLVNNSYAASFDGSSQYLSITNNTAFDFGTSTDFTIEAWIYPTAYAPSVGTTNDGVSMFSCYPTTGTLNGYSFSLSSTGSFGFTSWVSGTSQNIQTNNTIPLNTWTHLAVSRSGSTYRLFIDGTSVSFTGSITQAVNTNGNTIRVGALMYTTYYDYFPGYISNLRIIKGTALYTTNFTPPSTYLQAITNTVLLTCQNPTIVDNSTNAFTITNNGSVTTTLPSPNWTSLIGVKSKLYSNGNLQIPGEYDEVTYSMGMVSKLDRNGNFYVIGGFDEITYYQNGIPTRYLIAGGGGGGGGAGGPSTARSGGGGGGGGVLRNSNTLFTPGLKYNVTVGAGGLYTGIGLQGTNGANSAIICQDFPGNLSLTAIGGGGGGGANVPQAGNGGSGGGGGGSGLGKGLGTAGQGYDGADGTNQATGVGGGGGGAGGAGGGSGTPGPALFDDITGASYGYSRGGNVSFSQPPTNYGQGGNSATATDGPYNGFQGVVIISYPSSYGSLITTGTVSLTTVGSNNVYTFTSNGSFQFPPRS